MFWRRNSRWPWRSAIDSPFAQDADTLSPRATALGATDDTILAYWYRHERAARIYNGADEVYKTSLGQRILRRHHTVVAQPQ